MRFKKDILKLLFLTGILLFFMSFNSANSITIYYQKDASPKEILAAKELQKYIYMRLGELPSIQVYDSNAEVKNRAIVLCKYSQFEEKKNIEEIQGDAYLLKSNGVNKLFIVGGSSEGILYGAYKYIESLGVGFMIDGDIISEQKLDKLNLAGFNERHKPVFELRGIQPFHDFPEGPDWWNEEDYKAIISQLPKMGMNFIGFHTYPEKKPFGGWERAEPMVWIGTKDQFNRDGTVKSAYPALHSNTKDSTWAYYPKKTSEYHFGASQLFETDNYGADYMKNISGWPHTENENVEIFNKVGAMLGTTLGLAKDLGVKTCLGTETPLTIPYDVQQKMIAMGIDVNSKEAKVMLYEGIFSRIMATHPLDYYWFWTPETWTWDGQNDIAVEKTIRDIQSAIEAKKNVKAPFTLATSGWVLGPARDRAEFDNLFPKEMPFSVINREVGFTPVESAFKNVQNRPKWQISWLEDDSAMVTPQFWVGRILKDASDAYRYGCTGMMGIHWRTINLSASFMALARSGWEADSYKVVGDSVRHLDPSKLYKEWASLQFGPKASNSIGSLFASLDGGDFKLDSKDRHANFPRSADWGKKGPGMIKPNYESWLTFEKKYDFIKIFENSKKLVVGDENLERYNYWLNTFYYSKSQGKVGCILAEMERLNDQISKSKIKNDKEDLAKILLIKRKEVAIAWTEMEDFLMQTISTNGEMGTIANLEQHNLGSLNQIQQYDSILKAQLSNVPDLKLSMSYKGALRIVMPTRLTILKKGESLLSKVRILSPEAIKSVTIYYKALGEKEYDTKELKNIMRNVYQLEINPEEYEQKSFEYYIVVKSFANSVRFPVNKSQPVTVW
nr:alpha-glucuronidase family glycosyl hydrolase [uncultured Flavobacterium sp.]